MTAGESRDDINLLIYTASKSDLGKIDITNTLTLYPETTQNH